MESTPERDVVFRPYFIHPKTGQKVWAKHYGRKAWPIPAGRIGKAR